MHLLKMKLDLGKKNLVSENIWTFWWQKRVHKSINQQAFTEYLDQRCSNDRLKCLLGWKSCKCVFFCGKVSLDKAFAECYLRENCTEYFAPLFIEGGFSCVHTLHEVSLVLISKNPTFQDVMQRIKTNWVNCAHIKQELYCPVIG